MGNLKVLLGFLASCLTIFIIMLALAGIDHLRTGEKFFSGTFDKKGVMFGSLLLVTTFLVYRWLR
jgi:hypothetical protein